MISPTTESVYQQTELHKQVFESSSNHESPAQKTKKFLKENFKLKNPLKMPKALQPPDRNVCFKFYIIFFSNYFLKTFFF